jgi:hypothetical protein
MKTTCFLTLRKTTDERVLRRKQAEIVVPNWEKREKRHYGSGKKGGEEGKIVVLNEAKRPLDTTLAKSGPDRGSPCRDTGPTAQKKRNRSATLKTFCGV